MTPAIRPDTVDFHFDVLCPWAYQTSRWMREVRDQLGLTVNWRFFSLEEVNRVQGKRHPWEREWSYGWSILRIGAHLGRLDPKHLDDWYAVTGRALHVDGMKTHEPDVAPLLLEEIGPDLDLVDEAIHDESTNDEVKADHDKVLAAGESGVPTLFFPGRDGEPEQTIFGPVLIDPPSGDAEDAGKLKSSTRQRERTRRRWREHHVIGGGCGVRILRWRQFRPASMTQTGAKGSACRGQR